MKMSKAHTTQLWNSVIDNDYKSFKRINTRLLNAPTALKHIPIRIYVPSTAESSETGTFKVIQSLVHVASQERETQLLGQALMELMPTLFPSSRGPVMASILLHGAPVPFDAPLEELMKEATYPDGWLCFVVLI